MTTTTLDYTINNLSSHTGAEVHGIDLRHPIDTATRAQLNRAFVDHSVLVFRDQQLSPAQLLAAVQLFGEVFPQHNTKFSLPECPLIHYVSNQDSYPDGRRYIPGDGYHTDHSNAVEPPKATVLHAVRLPDRGWRHAVRQHASRLRGTSRGDEAPHRRAEGRPRLSKPL